MAIILGELKMLPSGPPFSLLQMAPLLRRNEQKKN